MSYACLTFGEQKIIWMGPITHENLLARLYIKSYKQSNKC